MIMSGNVPPPFTIPREFSEKLLVIGDLLDSGDDAKLLGENIIDELLPLPCDSDLKRVAYMLFTKGFKTFQAAQNLCRCGYGSDALSLCGVLFENIVDLLYVGQAPKRRPLRYMQYEQVEKYYQAQKVLRKKRLPKGRRLAYRGFEANLDRQTASLRQYFPNPYTGWSQKSLFQRAKKVGAEIAYYEKYWIYCGHKHTLPMGAVAWIVTPRDGGVSLPWYPDIKSVSHAAYESTELFLDLSTTFVRLLGLSKEPEITELGKRLRRIMNSLAQTNPEILEP